MWFKEPRKSKRQSKRQLNCTLKGVEFGKQGYYIYRQLILIMWQISHLVYLTYEPCRPCTNLSVAHLHPSWFSAEAKVW